MALLAHTTPPTLPPSAPETTQAFDASKLTDDEIGEILREAGQAVDGDGDMARAVALSLLDDRPDLLQLMQAKQASLLPSSPLHPPPPSSTPPHPSTPSDAQVSPCAHVCASMSRMLMC